MALGATSVNRQFLINKNDISVVAREKEIENKFSSVRAKVSTSRFRLFRAIRNNLISINYNITLRSDKQTFSTKVKIWAHSKHQRAGFELQCERLEELAIAVENMYQELVNGAHPLSENDQKIFTQINEKIAVLVHSLRGPLSNKGLIVISEQLKRWLQIKKGFINELTMHPVSTFSLNQPESDQSKMPLYLHVVFGVEIEIWGLMQSVASQISSMVNKEERENQCLSGLVFKDIDDFLLSKKKFFSLLKGSTRRGWGGDINRNIDCIHEAKCYEKFSGKFPFPYRGPYWYHRRKNYYQKLLCGRNINNGERKYAPITEQDLPRIAQLSGKRLQEVINEYVYYKTLEFMMEQFKRPPTLMSSLNSKTDGIRFESHGVVGYMGFLPPACLHKSNDYVKMDNYRPIPSRDCRGMIKGIPLDEFVEELRECGLKANFRHIFLSNCHAANRHEIPDFQPETLEEARLPRGDAMPLGLAFTRALFEDGFENINVTCYPASGRIKAKFPNHKSYQGSAFVQDIFLPRKWIRGKKLLSANSNNVAQTFTSEDLRGVPAGVHTERF